MYVETRGKAERRTAVLALAALLMTVMVIHGGSGRAEELLTKNGGSEYLGFDQGEGKFKTCAGSTVEYDLEDGDMIEDTDLICEKEDDPWPDVEAEFAPDEPPPE